MLDETSISLPEIQIGMNVAVQDHRTKLWDTYGVVTAISPLRQYHIKTLKRSVLVSMVPLCCSISDSFQAYLLSVALLPGHSSAILGQKNYSEQGLNLI